MALRAKVLPRLGASVAEGDGILVDLSGNVYTVSIDPAYNFALTLDDDLTAIAALGSTGIAVRSASNTWVQRSVAGTAGEITVTNGSGVSGDPTLSLPTSLTFTGKTITGGTYSGVTLSGTTTVSGGQLAFPATQSASSDANTLDDYEEGTWTPALTFGTPGNLAVVYSSQVGHYTKIGREVFFSGQLATSSFTHTTASGFFELTGFPFTMALTLAGGGQVSMRGWTKANYTHTALETSGGTFMYILATGSGQANAEFQVADVPSGGTIFMTFCGHYRV